MFTKQLKQIVILVLFCAAPMLFKAQNGYEIKINFKDCKDSTLYLAQYFFDQMPIVDSCKHIKNGKIVFKGERALDKGVYFLASQSRTSYYCQFIVDQNQKFSISFDGNAVASTLKSEDKQNQLFFSYIQYMTIKNAELTAFRQTQKGKSKADSAKAVAAKQSVLSKEMTDYDVLFREKNKAFFVADVMTLKADKNPTTLPLASNGRPDSIYQYYYFKNHYFDGLNWKDERILRTPFFADRLKAYFEHLVPQHPDSVIKELDKILTQCVPGSVMFNTLVGHFTYKYEQNKGMSFDAQGHSNTFEKVFIHLADKYIVSGKTDGYYSAETVAIIKDRVDILRNLLPGTKVPNLLMIDTIAGPAVLKMGFDTAHTSESVTYLYNQNLGQLRTLFKPLYSVSAKYTLLVFWAADCGHCKTEVPKLYNQLKALDGKVSYGVYAVQTKEELFKDWKEFMIEKKLNNWTHVFDPIHLNNLKDQFDINSTPVIYLLDKDKKIIAKKVAPEQALEIIQKIEELEKQG